MICTAQQMLFRDEVKEDELGGACDIYGVNEKYIQGFGDQP